MVEMNADELAGVVGTACWLGEEVEGMLGIEVLTGVGYEPVENVHVGIPESEVTEDSVEQVRQLLRDAYGNGAVTVTKGWEFWGDGEQYRLIRQERVECSG